MPRQRAGKSLETASLISESGALDPRVGLQTTCRSPLENHWNDALYLIRLSNSDETLEQSATVYAISTVSKRGTSSCRRYIQQPVEIVAPENTVVFGNPTIRTS